MEVKELRVGNNIKIDGIVVTIDERTIFDFNHDKRVKEPIPLTEDILLKCGFSKVIGSINEKYRKDVGAFYFQIVLMNDNKSYNVRLSNHRVEEGTDIVGIGIIHHLHQLQNLYFALTNQELTVTL